MDNLQFDYKKNEVIDKKRYFEEEGNLAFDADSKSQMSFMIETVCKQMQQDDEYFKKKLEATLKYDLPFFAINRRLVKNWILENFIF